MRRQRRVRITCRERHIAQAILPVLPLYARYRTYSVRYVRYRTDENYPCGLTGGLRSGVRRIAVDSHSTAYNRPMIAASSFLVWLEDGGIVLDRWISLRPGEFIQGALGQIGASREPLQSLQVDSRTLSRARRGVRMLAKAA